MSKNRTVGTQGEHWVAAYLNLGLAPGMHEWRRIESGHRPGSDVEAFDPMREAADPPTRYIVWEPHIEVRRRRTWDASGWARALIAMHGTRWVLWMRPRDARTRQEGQVRMHEELFLELAPSTAGFDASYGRPVDGHRMVDMTEAHAAELLNRRAAHHHKIKRELYWRDRGASAPSGDGYCEV